MAIQRKVRRGTKVQNDAFTGSEGELVQDTDTHRVVVHDGSIAGGVGVPNAFDLLTRKLIEATATGTDDYVVTLPYFPTAYASGQRITVVFTNANTDVCTINVNGVGISDLNDGEDSALALGSIEAGSTHEIEYDGTNWRLYTGSGGGAEYLETQVFTSSGTWAKPAGCKYVEVICTGAGATTSTGGTSSFGSHCSATGGTAGNTGSTGNGGNGGTATGGDINVRGGDGVDGGYAKAQQGATGGPGGASYWGRGGSNIVYGAGRDGARVQQGNYPSTYYAGGGGGAGATAIKTILDADLGSTETITVSGNGVIMIKAYG